MRHANWMLDQRMMKSSRESIMSRWFRNSLPEDCLSYLHKIKNFLRKHIHPGHIFNISSHRVRPTPYPLSFSAPVILGIPELGTEINDYKLLSVAGYAHKEIVYHVRFLQHITHESWLLKIKDYGPERSENEGVPWYNGNKNLVEVGPIIFERGRICIPIKTCKYGSLRKMLLDLYERGIHGIPERHILFVLKQLLKAMILYEETNSCTNGQLTAGHIFIDHDDEDLLKVKIGAGDAIFEDYRGATRNEFGGLSLPETVRLWDEIVPLEQKVGHGNKLITDMWMLGIIALEMGLGCFPPEFDEDKMRTYIDEFGRSVKENKGANRGNKASTWASSISLPPPIAEVDRFSPELKSFIAKCLSNDIYDRPTPKKMLSKKKYWKKRASAQEFARDCLQIGA